MAFKVVSNELLQRLAIDNARPKFIGCSLDVFSRVGEFLIVLLVQLSLSIQKLLLEHLILRVAPLLLSQAILFLVSELIVVGISPKVVYLVEEPGVLYRAEVIG